jgi:hypothetical protein
MFRASYHLLIGLFQSAGRLRRVSRQSFSAPQLHPIFNIHSDVTGHLLK